MLPATAEICPAVPGGCNRDRLMGTMDETPSVFCCNQWGFHSHGGTPIAGWFFHVFFHSGQYPNKNGWWLGVPLWRNGNIHITSFIVLHKRTPYFQFVSSNWFSRQKNADSDMRHFFSISWRTSWRGHVMAPASAPSWSPRRGACWSRARDWTAPGATELLKLISRFRCEKLGQLQFLNDNDL